IPVLWMHRPTVVECTLGVGNDRGDRGPHPFSAPRFIGERLMRSRLKEHWASLFTPMGVDTGRTAGIPWLPGAFSRPVRGVPLWRSRAWPGGATAPQSAVASLAAGRSEVRPLTRP